MGPGELPRPTRCVGCGREGDPEADAVSGAPWARLTFQLEIPGLETVRFEGFSCRPRCLGPATRSLVTAAEVAGPAGEMV